MGRDGLIREEQQIRQMHWEANGRPIRPAQESRHIGLQHVGLLVSKQKEKGDG